MAMLKQSWVYLTCLFTFLLSIYQYSHTSQGYIIVPLLAVALIYIIYYLQFGSFYYHYDQKPVGKVFRGKIPPAFPNGWFSVCRSEELKVGEVKHIKQSGNDIVMFRGEDKIAYALDAFCSHSGANMGINGKVKQSSCVQCPFHGWMFDGKTGNLVAGENLRPRKAENFSYTGDYTNCAKDPNSVIKKTGEGIVNIRKFLLKEMYGFIFIWLHSDPNAKPNYEPLDVTEYIKKLKFRGTSVNVVRTHVQDIAENGGDIRHFQYIHTHLLPFSNLIQAKWDAKWVRGDDPDLREKMKHEVPWINSHKSWVLNTFITPENAPYIGVMSLDMIILVPKLDPLFFFNGTILQVGPGLVYLFLMSPFYEALFFQHITSDDVFDHKVYHELFISNHLPYWVTAIMIRLEAQQVTNDTFVWSNKTFASEPKYNLASEADATILDWRKWFAQFYEGCAEKQAEMEKYTW